MKKEGIAALLLSFLIGLIFFYQIISGKIPFPGDSLVGNYQPYRSLSYSGFQPGAVPNKAQGPDVIKELLPWKKFVIESFKKSQIPFWDPYNFSGNPLMANFQSNVFYPGNLIFLVFNFGSAWSIYIILQPVLSIFFTFLFLRRLKIGFWPSILGGISFAFSLYMTVWMEYGNIGNTFLWLPLILYFSDKLLEKTNRTSFLGIVFAAFLAALGGYIQGLFYIYVVVFVYFFVKGHSEKSLNLRRSVTFISALVFPILLTGFQIFPTLELFRQSTRGNYSLDQIKTMLNPIYYLVTIVIPDFFGNPATRNYWFNSTYIERVSYFGLIPFTFAIFTIFTLFKKIEVKIFAILFVFSLLISTDLFITRFFYLIPIPVLSTTVATRILSIFAFSGAILAAFGFNEVIESKNKNKIIIIICILFIFLTGITVFLVFAPKLVIDQTLIANFNISKRNVYIPFGIFLIFAFSTFYYFSKINILKKYKKSVYILVIVVISSFELFYYFQKITPFAPNDYLYPVTPVVEYIKEKGEVDRYWGYGSAYIESNFQTYDATFSPEGNDPLHIKNYTELLAASKNGRLPVILPRPDANIAGGFGKEDLANNSFRQKVLNITGVKYVVNKDEGINGNFNPDYVTFPQNNYKLVWQKGFWQVYQNLNVTPRFFITNKYVVSKYSKAALRILLDPNFSEKDSLVLNDDPNISSGPLVSNLKLLNYSPNRISFLAKTSVSGLLYLSDNYYPGWRAYVDNKETKIYLTDYTFRSVVVPTGQHKVVFEYAPTSFYYGLYASIVGVGLLVLFTLIYVKKVK